MWPFKKTQLAAPEEFPEVIDALANRLRSAGFDAEADRLDYLVHKFIATTSNELYGEFSVALRVIQRECASLPADLAAEIRRLLKSIDKICPWR